MKIAFFVCLTIEVKAEKSHAPHNVQLAVGLSLANAYVTFLSARIIHMLQENVSIRISDA